MSLKEMLGIRCLLIFCPQCSRIKRHGKWVTLTPEESQKLSSRHSGFDLQEEVCGYCEVEKALGV